MTDVIHGVRGIRAGEARPLLGLQQTVSAADYVFACFIFVIASWAFTFLGVTSLFWVAAYAYLILRIAMSFRTFMLFTVTNALFLLYPALCLLSVLWSDVTRDTLAFGMQITMSVLIGLFIGMRLSLGAIFRTYVVALLIMMFFSLLNINSAFAPAFNHENNFGGIFLHKNTLGMSAVQAVIAFIFCAFLLRNMDFKLRALSVVGLVVVVFFLMIGGSATAVALGIVMATVAIALVLAVKWPPSLLLMVSGCVTGTGVAIITIIALDVDPVTEILGLLGRDPTLTGRTNLWEFGLGVYLSRPIFGFGAAGFWSNPAYASEIVTQWRLYGEGIVSFHNLPLELLVSLGPLGLLTHSLFGVITLWRAARHQRRTGDELAIWVIVLVIYLYTNEMTDNVLHLPHHISLILLVACGSALSKSVAPPHRPVAHGLASV
jgi:exopolysaccharide production protein ExoQ